MSTLRSVPSPRNNRWDELVEGFLPCHQSAASLWMHAVTTPLGLIGLLAFLGLVSPVLPVIAAIWMVVWLLERLPGHLSAATALVLAASVAAALVLPWGWWGALGAFVAGSFGQDAAHWLTGEPAFQSSDDDEHGWMWHFLEQGVFLVPLIIDAMWKHTSLFAPFTPSSRIAHGTLSGGSLDDLGVIREWVGEQALSLDRTTHWRHRDLPHEVQGAFRQLEDSEEVKAIIQARFGEDYVIEPVYRMNELHVVSERSGLISDTVFCTSHVDGPLTVFPFSSVFRCMVAVTPSRRIATHFPMANADYSDPESVVLDTADVLAFDFNRELHYISETSAAGPRLSEAGGCRVTLKLHFAIVPHPLQRWGQLHGLLTGRYNELARQVFLGTIAPVTLMGRLGAMWILSTNRAFEAVQRWAGATNLAYVLLAGTVSYALSSLTLFILLTGFVHYGLYIATFAHRRDICYGNFLRDCIFFKVVSMGTLTLVALSNLTLDPLALLLICSGFGIAAMAASALGKERTYFGVELERVPPRHIHRFPYGTVPHPMILGAIVGLLGLHAMSGFRAVLPWVIPVHIGLYLLHLLQEQMDDQMRPPEQGPDIRVVE